MLPEVVAHHTYPLLRSSRSIFCMDEGTNWIDECVDYWKDGWLDKLMDRWLNGCMNALINRCLSGRIVEWLNG